MMKRIYSYMTMCIAAMAFAACTNGLEENALPTDALVLTVGDYPTFSEGTDTRVGNFDAGKTAWEEGDRILVSVTSTNGTLQSQYATLTYENNTWTPSQTLTRPFGSYTINAWYAPAYEWNSGTRFYSFAVGGYKGDDYYYKMAADIELSTYTDWTPIDVFFGTFDGNGHAIKNLKRTTFESSFQFGLFDRNTGKIKNLQIEDCNIVNSGNTDSYAAAIANQNGGTIENCHIINGKISAYTQVAGIAITNTGIILACSNSASLNWQAVTEAMNAQLGSYSYRYVQRNGTNQLPVIEATEQSQCPLIKSIGYPCPTVSDTHNEEYQIPLTGQTKQHNV